MYFLAPTLLCSKRPGGGLYEASPEDNYHYTIALGLLRMKAHITLWCIKIGALDGIWSYLMYLILFIELILHLPRVKQMNSQPIHLTNELIFCIHITRGCRFELVNFSPRSSLICSHTFLEGFGHFHDSTQTGQLKSVL